MLSSSAKLQDWQLVIARTISKTFFRFISLQGAGCCWFCRTWNFSTTALGLWVLMPLEIWDDIFCTLGCGGCSLFHPMQGHWNIQQRIKSTASFNSALVKKRTSIVLDAESAPVPTHVCAPQSTWTEKFSISTFSILGSELEMAKTESMRFLWTGVMHFLSHPQGLYFGAIKQSCSASSFCEMRSCRPFQVLSQA